MLYSPLRLSPLAVALWLAASPSQAVELEPQVITANPLGNRQLAAPSTVLEGDNLLQQQHGSCAAEQLLRSFLQRRQASYSPLKCHIAPFHLPLVFQACVFLLIK
jgi:hypothetical protein